MPYVASSRQPTTSNIISYQKCVFQSSKIRRKSKNETENGKFSIKSSKTQIQLCGFITFLLGMRVKAVGHFGCFCLYSMSLCIVHVCMWYVSEGKLLDVVDSTVQSSLLIGSVKNTTREKELCYFEHASSNCIGQLIT